ncbi:cyclomaltodextrinase C-terminal domain-containing protein [Aliifodinibius salicampi]|uniref:Cyclomaltodextrinase C-terminal domain-containing protein n=1 Tax=Fodinibius salicampi TaxID=1920655 RepID=A0ABT3PVZ4_9BACT|nr:alpha-amylase family glycosyl hydrolase [Fodinibius salicampi]MCW9712003.1 cyclomaltodextrinase C-terminal domain-containing protein [Fodinibius salicampi]
MIFKEKALKHLSEVYDKETASELIEKIQDRIQHYGFSMAEEETERSPWHQKETILISYGDVIDTDGHENRKLKHLENFLEEYVGNVITSLHILPFFPSSSDQGFSVIDYKKVREDLGQWSDIERLSEKYQLMADLVINHTSRYSEWFENYQMGKQPGKEYFIEVDPDINLSDVTRPRSSPLLTAVQTSNGLRHVWTTFSDDQIDLDFSNPEVLLEYIDIFLFYLSEGIQYIRLDAIAYLWKEIGTNSIHLDKTHRIVKLFRAMVDSIDPDRTLITETNVPFDENVSYFGSGDEAHMIYQFSLPPLLLHAILTENAEYLTDWAKELPAPPKGCTYFNFTASHDGIGVRPLEGLVPDEEFKYLVESAKKRGGFVSYKTNADGSQSPYELNITYFDAFEEPGITDTDLQLKRYLCSQVIMLSLQGVPGIYFHNLVATKNDMGGVLEDGEKRSINRKKWSYQELKDRLDDTENTAHIVLNYFKRVLGIRKEHPAFSPAAKQKVLSLKSDLFAFIRESETEKVLVISNLTNNQASVESDELSDFAVNQIELTDLLSDNKREIDPELTIDPFETLWLTS